ncbi:MAG: TonB-dependent receptor [Gemmatimonadales bacterium]
MPRVRLWVLAGVLVILMAAIPPALAGQSGSLSGRVTSSDGGRPIGGAIVTVQTSAGIEAARVPTGGTGRYRIPSLGAGTYRVTIAAIGHQARTFETVQVGAGGGAMQDAVLEMGVTQIEELTVVSHDRAQVPEKATQAPASVFALSSAEITERPVLSVTDHLRSIPGVDISQGGLVQSNVVGRGFNNIFSGALLTLIDYRYAAVPSLRVNVPTFFPATNDDIYQIEFVLGPGAALYGPNAANGVLNIITKSPFNSAGGVLNFETGARAGSEYVSAGTTLTDGGASLWRASGRYAAVLSSKVAFKVSGDYLSGTEWRMRDEAEPANLSTSRPELGLPAGLCNAQTGCRDFDLERYGGEARFDIRPNGDTDTEIIGVVGHTNAKRLVEYTGIGAGQARGWKYTTGQMRFRHKRFFVQGFGNFSNAGETFLLRDGNPIVDESRLWSAQFQHGFDLGSRETILYGADYFHTDARTGGTINGSNEGDDTIKEIGGYVHSVTRLTPKLDLVAALRVDKHSRLEDAVWSPRAGLVLRPNEDHNLRVTFNRAFSTPSNNNLFLDIVASRIPLSPTIGYDVRALGVPKAGFRFRENGGCAGGVDNLCMRSPFAPQLGQLPARAVALWSAAVQAVSAAAGPQLTQLMLSNPPTTQVGTQLRLLNPTTRQFLDIAPAQVQDIERMKPTITQSIEGGWKGRLANGKVQLSIDGWFERKRNFVGPLIVESPTVFLDRPSTIAYLTALFTGAGVPNAAATAAAIGTGMAGVSAATTTATTGVPLATVVPNNTPLTARPDIFLTYRNFGEVELYGSDLAFDWMATSTLSFSGSYSWMSDDFFPKEEAGGPTDIALNATRSKGSIAAAWRDVFGRGGAEIRFRAVKGFPVNSGVYVSPPDPEEPGRLLPIDSYGVVDLQGNWKLPIAARSIGVAASLQNVFNKKYASFVGVPRIGRLFLTKISYTF